jgi:hypothetical protein
VALLGGATAITMAAPAPASAATQQVAERAVTAPVQLPDGRTMRITGMGGYGHQATPGHIATVAAFKTDTSPNTSTGLAQDDGVGTDLQNPLNTPRQIPANYNQQITTQSAGGGVVAVGVVAILTLAIIVFFKVKHGHIKAFDAVLTGLLGISLAGTVIGTMGSQLTNSVVGSLGSMLGGLG